MQLAKQNPLVVLEMRRHGLTQAETARVFGCSEDTVYRVLSAFPREQRRRLPKDQRRPDVARSQVQRLLAGVPVAAGARVPSGPVLSMAEKRALTNEQLQAALDEHDGDWRAAAAVFGIYPEVVRRRLGLVKPMAKASMSVAEMRRRYEAGASLSEVADQAGVCLSTCHRTLRTAGVQMRRQGGEWRRLPSVDRHAHVICALYRAGASTSMLGQAFGVHPNVVGRRLRAEGVPLRTGGWAGVVRDAQDRARLTRACRAAADGRLVVEAGRLVRVDLDRQTLSIARGGEQA